MGKAIAAEGIFQFELHALMSDLLIVAFGSRSMVSWDVKRVMCLDVDRL